jgi:hypothetical protein
LIRAIDGVHPHVFPLILLADSRRSIALDRHTIINVLAGGRCVQLVFLRIKRRSAGYRFGLGDNDSSTLGRSSSNRPAFLSQRRSSFLT